MILLLNLISLYCIINLLLHSVSNCGLKFQKCVSAWVQKDTESEKKIRMLFESMYDIPSDSNDSKDNSSNGKEEIIKTINSTDYNNEDNDIPLQQFISIFQSKKKWRFFCFF